MSTSLADALNKVGLITDEEKSQVLADQARMLKEREDVARQLARKGNKSERMFLIQGHTSISEFKDLARKVLCESPDLIEDIIKLAHHFKKREGGAKLIWLCYQVRGLLPRVAAEKRERFLRRAFRSAGSVVEIPD